MFLTTTTIAQSLELSRSAKRREKKQYHQHKSMLSYWIRMDAETNITLLYVMRVDIDVCRCEFFGVFEIGLNVSMRDCVYVLEVSSKSEVHVGKKGGRERETKTKKIRSYIACVVRTQKKTHQRIEQLWKSKHECKHKQNPIRRENERGKQKKKPCSSLERTR